jgi:hypothetical protein
LAGRRATESADGAQPPFVNLVIKIDADDLADDFINNYFENDDYINVVSEESTSTRHQVGMSTTMPNAL